MPLFGKGNLPVFQFALFTQLQMVKQPSYFYLTSGEAWFQSGLCSILGMGRLKSGIDRPSRSPEPSAPRVTRGTGKI